MYYIYKKSALRQNCKAGWVVFNFYLQEIYDDVMILTVDEAL